MSIVPFRGVCHTCGHDHGPDGFGDPEKIRAEQDATLSGPEVLASRLIDAWVRDKGQQIPWSKAVEITAVVMKMDDAERARLLSFGNDE